MFDPEEMISVEKDEETPEGKKTKKESYPKNLGRQRQDYNNILLNRILSYTI